MHVRIVAMAKGRIIVRMDFDDRNSRADDSHSYCRKYQPASTHVDCRQTGHSAGTVPDSSRRFKHLGRILAEFRESASSR